MADTKIPDAIRWQEGMRLVPQHFQQQDLRQQRLLSYLLNDVLPDHWGVTLLKGGVQGNRYELEALEAIMPDGLHLRFQKQSDRTLSIELSPPACVPGPDGLLHIALGVVSHAESQANGIQGAAKRYTPMRPELADLNTGAHQQQLETQRPKLQLLCIGAAEQAGMDLLTLARFKPGSDARHVSDYTPPMPRVMAGTPLHELLRARLALLQEHYDRLRQRCRDAGKAVGADPGDTVSLALSLAALGARLPELHAALQGGATHPRQLYLLLCGVLGALTATDPGASIKPPPDFLYLELQACFTELLDRIGALLNKFPSRYARVAFVFDQRRSYRLDEAPRRAPCYIGLRVPPGASAGQMEFWLNEAWIGSASRIEQLSHNRVPGLGRGRLDEASALAVESSGDYAVFSLSIDDHDYFRAGEPLLVRQPDDSAGAAPAQIVYYRPAAPFGD